MSEQIPETITDDVLREHRCLTIYIDSFGDVGVIANVPNMTPEEAIAVASIALQKLYRHQSAEVAERKKRAELSSAFADADDQPGDDDQA